VPVQNIFAANPLQQVSPMQVQAGLTQNALAQANLAHSGIQIQQAQSDFNANQALRAALSGGADPNTPEGMAALTQADPLGALKIRQQIISQQKEQAETEKFRGQGTEANAKATESALSSYRSMLPNVQNPQQYAQWVSGLYSDPRTAGVAQSFGPKDQVLAQVPTDPAQFQDFLQKNAMGMDKYIQNQTALRGQNMTQQNVNATNATHVQTTAMTNATSTANNRANITKDLQIAGLNTDGSVNGNVESMAQAIAKGEIAPLSGFALARPAGQQVMARVMQINPDYDATTYGAKAAAAKAFTSGPQGNSLRSFAVAGQHLDQLGQLADALDNGNIQLINKVAQTVATQTGNPAPTNFDAAKDIVSKEVVKAIVAGGGGVAERQELKDSLDKAKSPAQLKGVITQYRNLMSAQHDALLQQRQAAGLPDSTLPNYAQPAAAPGKVVNFSDLK
jgi:hypothetical protein